MKYCNKCDLKISNNNHYCPQCYGKISLICPSCGAENEEDSEFCGECGARIIFGHSQADNKPQAAAPVSSQRPQQQSSFSSYAYANNGQQNSNSSSKSYTNLENSSYSNSGSNKNIEKVDRVDKSEKVIATLGSGYISNIISNGSISSTSAVLTDKRVYCSGNMLIKDGKIWRKMKMSKIVEAVDITGTGFTYSSQVEWLAAIIIDIFLEIMILVLDMSTGFTNFLFIALAIVFGILFIVNKKTIFQIEYAGGIIGFTVNWFNPREMVNFQKQIHLIKNKCRAEERENG